MKSRQGETRAYMSLGLDRRNSSLLLIATVAGCVLMSATFMVFGMEISFLVACGVTGIYVSLLSARAALVLWLISICMLPFWAGLRYFAYIPPSSIVGLGMLAGIMVRTRTKPTTWDFYTLYFFALVSALGVIGISLPGHTFSSLTQWALSYIVGRYLVEQAGREFTFRAISIIFTLVAVLVIFEFVLNWNPFYATNSGAGQFAQIGEAQERGGIIRAEWAFGHSIALSNSLALVVPIVLGSGLKTSLKLVSVAIISVAGLLTFSRSGIVSIILAILLTMYVGRDRVNKRTKVWVVSLLAIVVVAAYPYMSSIFRSASEETARSADHRLRIFELFPYLNPLGLADDYAETSSGVFNWHGVISIDNSFLRIAINFGYIVAAIAIIYFLVIAVQVARRRENLAWISLASIGPALFTVALITQFGSLVWFFIGMASLLSRETHDPSNVERSDHLSEQQTNIRIGKH